MHLRVTILVAIICLIGYVAARRNNARRRNRDQGVTQLTAASSEFSQNLYNEIAVNQPNAIFLPFSAHTCLSMALLGARGTTANEMTSVLQLGGVSSPHRAYGQLLQGLNSVRGVKLLVANGMFVNPNFSIKRRFQRQVTSRYLAEADNINMQAPGGPEAPINAWIADKTEDKITDVLPPGFIDDETAMVLVNTVFFNGTWYNTFEVEEISRADFYKDQTSQVEVDLMHQTKRFPIKQEAIEGVDVVSLPFPGGRFSFVIALPRSRTGLSSLETYITQNAANLETLFEGLEYRIVDLYLPKFELTATIDLKTPLQNLGIDAAFEEFADFSGISRSSVKISEVIQKAQIEVREEGTVAAAATAIKVMPQSAFIPPTDPVVFRADHPFMYFLRDSETGLILFQGKLTDPEITEFEV